MASRTIDTGKSDTGDRLDLVLRRYLTDRRRASRTRVQRWIRDGAVTLNGRPVDRPAARIATGDRIQIRLPEEPPRLTMSAEVVPLDVLFEDEHVLVVNKPSGMVVHPTFRHATGTLMNGLLWRARNWPSSERPSLVGRLDRLTSGLVLVAKTRRAHASLQRALATEASRKEYLAIVYGRVTPWRGTIHLRLHRDDRDRRRVIASTVRGLESTTQYERLAHTRTSGVHLALLRCRLVTGRTHQIRVHLATRGWPVVGDPVYGEPRWSTVNDETLAVALRTFPRQALHAWRLAFPHPMTGTAVRLEAPVPDDMHGLATLAGLTPDQGLPAVHRRAAPSDGIVW